MSDFEIRMIPVLEDNYLFVVWNKTSKKALVIDPAVYQPVQEFLNKQNLKLCAILNTHHHFDHVGANLWLAKNHTGIEIYGAEHDAHRIPGITKKVREGDTFTLLGQSFQVLDVKGHTLGHIAYVMNPDSDTPHVFVGDTLFGGGCGKLFEGSFSQMLESLKKIRSLKPLSKIWCAHEYTEKNFQVACALEPDHQALQMYFEKIKEKRRINAPTVPLELQEEIKYNPFLRWDCSQLKRATQTTTDLETFTATRNFRDKF